MNGLKPIDFVPVKEVSTSWMILHNRFPQKFPV